MKLRLTNFEEMKATISSGETSGFQRLRRDACEKGLKIQLRRSKRALHYMHVRDAQDESLQALLLTLPPKKIKYYVLQIYKTR